MPGWVRFVFLLGLYPFELFFLFFLEDRFNLRGAVQTTTFLVLAALVVGGVGAVVAGILSDHVGRKTSLTFGILTAAAGCFGIAFSPTCCRWRSRGPWLS